MPTLQWERLRLLEARLSRAGGWKAAEVYGTKPPEDIEGGTPD